MDREIQTNTIYITK